MNTFLLLTLLAQSPSPSTPPVFRNTVEINDVHDEEMISALTQFVGLVKSGEKEVTFRIDSFGGSIFLGMKFIQIIEDIKRLEGVHTVCVVDSKAMSMGIVILESGVCDMRLMTKRSVLLAHNASSRVEGTAEQMRQEASFLDALNTSLAEMVAGRAGLPTEFYKGKVAHGDWVMAWEEALSAGLIDGTVSPFDVAPPVLL